MKKIIASLLICLTISMASCINTEEKITINQDQSGTYELSVDFGSLIEQLKAIKPGEINDLGGNKDTVIYFKSLTDTASALTDEEKNVLENGSIHILLNSEKNQMKMAFHVPFAGVQQLQYLKQHMLEMIQKLKAQQDLFGPRSSDSSASNGENYTLPEGMGTSAGNLLNPSQKAFQFNIENNTITNKLADKKIYDDWIANDSTIKMIRPMLSMLGDFTYTTTFILPSPVKKYTGGEESKLSADKKTITFTNSLSGMLDKPESFEYSIEY